MTNARKIRIIREKVSDSDATPDLVDLGLIHKAQEGDEDAFAVLWKQIESRVTQQVGRLLLRNESDVPDVVNRVALKVWQSIRQFRGDSKFSTWLFPIVRHRCFEYWKGKRKDSKNDPLDDQIGVKQPKHVHEIEVREIAQRVHDRLKQKDQRIIELIYTGQSREDVAARLGIKVDHVAYVLGVFLKKVRAESQTNSPGKRTVMCSKGEEILRPKKKGAVGS